MLTNAAIAGSIDNLRGLKENVIIGHLIPAGTGIKEYKRVRLFDDTSEDLDASINAILEQRKLEKELGVGSSGDEDEDSSSSSLDGDAGAYDAADSGEEDDESAETASAATAAQEGEDS